MNGISVSTHAVEFGAMVVLTNVPSPTTTLDTETCHEEVKITGFDYTICDEGDCVSMLIGNGVDDLVVLGGGFLRGVKSIFDLEGDKVGCKFSAHLEYSAHPTNMLTTGHSFGTRSSRMKAGKGTFILC